MAGPGKGRPGDIAAANFKFPAIVLYQSGEIAQQAGETGLAGDRVPDDLVAALALKPVTETETRLLKRPVSSAISILSFCSQL